MKLILNSQNYIQNHTGNLHIVTIIDIPSYNSSNNNDSANNFFLNFPGQPESIRQLSKKFLGTHIPEVGNSTFFKRRAARRTKRGTKERKTTVEIAVFFDAAAFRIFAPYFNYDNNKIRDMLLAYINAVIILF